MTRLPAAILLTVLVALSALVSPAAATADGEMSQQRAGAYFHSYECDAERAGDTYNNKVFGPDNWIKIPEIQRRLPELRRLTGGLARFYERQVRRLYNPPAPWPASVDPLISKHLNVMIRRAEVLGEMASANTANQFLDRGRRYNRLDFGTTPIKIRAILNIPTRC